MRESNDGPSLGTEPNMSSESSTSFEAVIAQARELWPGITISEDSFARFIADRAGGDRECRPDLVLACACLAGDPAALAVFEERLLAPVVLRLARSGMGRSVADEVTSRLRETLFVGVPGGAPRLASYSGRGELRGWLEVVATREAYKVARKEPSGSDDDQILASLPDDDDLELRHIKAQHRSELGRAFSDALASLTTRERLLLRQRYLDQLTLDEVGALQGVHRITVMRWLARIEKTLMREIRRSLMARLKLAESEIAHLVDDARSRFDLSLRGLLDARSTIE